MTVGQLHFLSTEPISSNYIAALDAGVGTAYRALVLYLLKTISTPPVGMEEWELHYRCNLPKWV